MGRLANRTILTNTINGGNFIKHKLVDLTTGGQNGWSPNPAALIGDQVHVSEQLNCVVLEAPKAFDILVDGQKWTDTLVAIMENHAKSIEGLTSTIENEFAEDEIGGNNEKISAIVDSKRAQSSVKISLVDKVGRPMRRFFQEWSSLFMKDPDTKIAMISQYIASEHPMIDPAKAAGFNLDLLPDQTSMTAAFFTTDITHRFIMDAWIGRVMQPKSSGTIEAKRDLQSAAEVADMEIEFTGAYEYNSASFEVSQRLLDAMNASGGAHAFDYARASVSDLAVSPSISR